MGKKASVSSLHRHHHDASSYYYHHHVFTYLRSQLQTWLKMHLVLPLLSDREIRHLCCQPHTHHLMSLQRLLKLDPRPMYQTAALC